MYRSRIQVLYRRSQVEALVPSTPISAVRVLSGAGLAYQFDPPELYIEAQTLFDTEGGQAHIAFALESDAHSNHPQLDTDEPRVLTERRLLHYLAHCVPWPWLGLGT